MEHDQARAALEAARAATDNLERTARDACPPWRHAAFGVVMATLVLSVALSMPLRIALFVLAMAGVAWLAAWDRRHSGIFVNGFRRGPTLPVSLVLMGAMMGLVFAEVRAQEHGLGVAAYLGIAALAFVLACLASVQFQRIYLRELREGSVA